MSRLKKMLTTTELTIDGLELFLAEARGGGARGDDPVQTRSPNSDSRGVPTAWGGSLSVELRTGLLGRVRQ